MSIVTQTPKSTFILLFLLCLSPYLYAQPTISSFSPSSGPVGTAVVINGTNFNSVAANNIVYFGAVKALVSSATSNALTVVVPNGATYQPITVNTNGLTAYSTKPFIVTFPGGGTITSNSFEDKTSLSAGESPYGIASADLDGDGKPDMAVVNGGYPYSLSIYKNTSTGGNISFADKIDIPTGIVPFSIAISDIDGDGKPDIVITNQFSFSISVFRNIGTPGNISFDTRVDLPALNPNKVVIGDLNNDGKPDLVVANYVAHSISIYKNTSIPGNVSFTARIDYPTGRYPTDVSKGDIDGDSWQDVVVANQESNYISIFKNDAAPGISFTVNNNLITGVAVYYVILTDLDGDNKPDLGVNKGSNSISVYRNISNAGSFSFSAGLDFTIAGNPGEFSITDLDGDGKPDLAVVCGSSLISVLKNTSSSGSFSFQNKVDFLTGSAPYGLSIADFNGDNKPDLATVDQGDNAVSLLRNQVDGPDITSFSPTSATAGATVTITGARFTGITQVRFGNVPAQTFTVVSPSTIQAVVGMGASGEVSVTGSKGTARAKGFIFLVPAGLPPPVITSFTPASGAVGTTVTITGKNFDGFPANNIVYFGATRATVLSASANSLSVQVPRGTTYAPITVTTNQLTASSALPFVSTFETGPAFTSNSFDKPKLVDQNNGSHIANADIDGDGKIDIVYGGLIAARNTSTINSISFSSPQSVIPGLSGGLYEFGDIDSDGKQDLVRMTTSYDATISILKNISSVGTFSFTNAASFLIPDKSSAFAIKDLDIDGKPDLITSNYDNDFMAIYRNTSYGSVIQFDAKVDVATGDGPVHVSSGDLDGDGKPEVVITNNAGNSISIFPNNSVPGTISLGTKLTYNALGGALETTLADFDGDGKLDIAAVAYGGNFFLYKNTSTVGAISFSLLPTFYTYSFPLRMRAADLDGDGKPDLAFLSESMESISVFKNTSNSTNISFALHVWYTTEYIYGDLEIADFNGDGKNDIVLGVDRTGIGIVKNSVGTAKTVPSGSNPVKGEIRNRVTVDQTVETYNGKPYVQRHYDIEPVENPGTSTATVTLYFMQQEFDNFNAFPGHGVDLPTNPSDNGGIANLRIYQYHGFSGTSVPGSYSGFGIEINPTDANIIWNIRASCWEVTFDVTGFSGFFVSNGSFNNLLPPVITAGSNTSFCQGGNVVITSSATIGNQWYKDGLMITGATQPGFQATASGVYTATITVNGSTSLASNSIAITVAAAPAQPVISSDGTTLTSSAASGNQWYREGVAVAGAVNQTYKPLDAANYTVTVTIGGCTSPFAAGYYFVPAPVITTAPGTIICQGGTVVLTSSALSNNQWYKDGVSIAGATARTYQANQGGIYAATTANNNVASGLSNKITLTTSAGPAKPTITVNGADLVSSATTGNQWYGGGVKIQGATNKTFKPLANGNYSVVTTDPGTGCSTESDMVYFAITGIINIDNTHFVKLSPNPVINEILINYELAGLTAVNLEIIDIQGHVCANYYNLSDGRKLSLAGITKGIYLARITDLKSKKNYIIKLIKL